MVAFNFQAEFVEAIKSGRKTQTIRKTRRARPGDILQLYTGMRTQACTLIAIAKCTAVGCILLCPRGISISGQPVAAADDFARADGFDDYKQMLAWFEKKYGASNFTGVLHKWKIDR